MRKYPTNRVQISYLCEHHLLSIYAMVKYWITWAFLSIIFLTDWYFYRNLRLRLKHAPAWLRKGLIILQFVMGAFYSTYFIADTLSQGAILGRHFKIWVIRSFFVIYIPKTYWYRPLNLRRCNNHREALTKKTSPSLGRPIPEIQN